MGLIEATGVSDLFVLVEGSKIEVLANRLTRWPTPYNWRARGVGDNRSRVPHKKRGSYATKRIATRDSTQKVDQLTKMLHPLSAESADVHPNAHKKRRRRKKSK